LQLNHSFAAPLALTKVNAPVLHIAAAGPGHSFAADTKSYISDRDGNINLKVEMFQWQDYEPALN
jgi:hypothetical protein